MEVILHSNRMRSKNGYKTHKNNTNCRSKTAMSAVERFPRPTPLDRLCPHDVGYQNLRYINVPSSYDFEWARFDRNRYMHSSSSFKKDLAAIHGLSELREKQCGSLIEDTEENDRNVKRNSRHSFKTTTDKMNVKGVCKDKQAVDKNRCRPLTEGKSRAYHCEAGIERQHVFNGGIHCCETNKRPVVILTDSIGVGKSITASHIMDDCAGKSTSTKEVVSNTGELIKPNGSRVAILKGKQISDEKILLDEVENVLSASPYETTCVILTHNESEARTAGDDYGRIESRSSVPGVHIEITDGAYAKVIQDLITALTDALRNDHEAFEEYKSNLLGTDKLQRNAAHQAAITGDLERLMYLLDDVGIPADTKSSNRLTILHLAVMNGRDNVAEFLCKSNPALIHATDTIGRTVLHISAQKNNMRILRDLIEHGADVYSPAGDGCTILHIAASHEVTDMVSFLCSNFHFNYLNIANKLGMYPIHFAARCSIRNVELLLEKGEVPDVRTNTGATILHVSAHHGRLDVMKYICENHDELLMMTDKAGLSAAHTAARHGHLACLKYLLAFGKVPLISKRGLTVIHSAARNGKLEALKYLCERYPSLVGNRDIEQWTAAHHAATGGHVECLEFLCSSSVVDPNATEKNGMTILDIATRAGKSEVVQWIQNAFGNVNTKIECLDNTLM